MPRKPAYNFTPPPWTAVQGDVERLMYKGKRAYFPHVVIGKPQPNFDGHTGNTLTINEAGKCNDGRHGDSLEAFDCNARLIAKAPEMALLLQKIYKGFDATSEDIAPILEYIDPQLIQE